MSDNNWPKMLYKAGATQGEVVSRTFKSAEEFVADGDGWGSRRKALGLPESAQPVLVNEADVKALKDELAATKATLAARDAEIKALKDELGAVKGDEADKTDTQAKGGGAVTGKPGAAKK